MCDAEITTRVRTSNSYVCHNKVTICGWQCQFDSVTLTVSLWQCHLDSVSLTVSGWLPVWHVRWWRDGYDKLSQSLSLMSFVGLETKKKKNEIGENSIADDKTDHYSEISTKVMQPKSRKSKRKIVRNLIEKHCRNSHTFSECTNFIRVRNFIRVQNSAPSNINPLTLLISTVSSMCESW